jgi:hypothetical protein
MVLCFLLLLLIVVVVVIVGGGAVVVAIYFAISNTILGDYVHILTRKELNLHIFTDNH